MSSTHLTSSVFGRSIEQMSIKQMSSTHLTTLPSLPGAYPVIYLVGVFVGRSMFYMIMCPIILLSYAIRLSFLHRRPASEDHVHEQLQQYHYTCTLQMFLMTRTPQICFSQCSIISLFNRKILCISIGNSWGREFTGEFQWTSSKVRERKKKADEDKRNMCILKFEFE